MDEMTMDKPLVHMIGNTHFDPVWLWTWDEAMASVRATFRAALDRMKEEPAFRYSFSCVPVFEWIEKTEPMMLEEIKKRVASGQWKLDEGMYLQPDCFSASGESYIRQCLYGQRYLKKTFGCYSDTAFNADCFGCPETLPQILLKSRIPYAVFGRPDTEDLPLRDQFFNWVSPDGSRVLACRLSGRWGAWTQDVEKDIDEALAYSDTTAKDTLVVYGVTDHGGAPTKRAIASILRKSRENGGRVVFSGTSDYFHRRNAEGAPADTVHELPIRFFGVFSDIPEIKKENRDAEYALLFAERMAVLEARPKEAVPMLRRAWEDVLFNQFHDILGGSSIRDAYKDAFHKAGRAMTDAGEYLHFALQRMTREIDLPSDPEVFWNLVVWNLHPFAYDGPIEAEVQWAWEFPWYEGEITLTDGEGNEYPAQIIAARECIPGFRSRFVFRAAIPAMGYRVFRVFRRAASEAFPAMPTLENDLIRVTPDEETGGIREITDLKTGRILAHAVGKPVVYGDESDVWAFNFTGYGKEEGFRVESIETLEKGPLRARVHVRAVYHLSVLESDYILYRGASSLEVRYRLFWQEPQKTLKFSFQAPEAFDSYLAAVPAGETRRPSDGKEMPVGPHVLFGGMTLFSDSLFSASAMKDTLETTVVRSPVYGDLRIGELPGGSHEYLGHGVHEGRFLLDFAPHSAASRRNAAESFLKQVTVIDESHHDGFRPMEASFFTLESTENAVRLLAMKPAEDASGDIILRFENASEKPAAASFALQNHAPLNDLAFAPYEIKTVRLGKDARETDLLEE